MTNSEKLFLAAAEELSFSRAAAKCFITQQCLSDHVRRLEQKYGRALFVRRPQVALTQAGEALVRMLRRQGQMERDLERELGEIDAGDSGCVTVGINPTRARILVPALLSRFSQRHPNVELRFILDDTRRMVERLEAGELDCLIGVNAAQSDRIVLRPLMGEPIYLVVPDGLLPGADREHPVSWQTLAQVKLVRNAPGSTLNALIDQAALRMGVRLREAVSVSDYDVQFTLCARGGLAAFCPGMIACAEHGPAERPGLRVAAVEGLTQQLQLSLVYDAERYYPRSAQEMFFCIEETVKALPIGFTDFFMRDKTFSSDCPSL